MLLSAYFFISILLALYYVFIIIRVYTNWDAIPEFKVQEDFHFSGVISVIIAARNEAVNIKPCVQSILSNNCSSDGLELLVIDDHSTDETYSILSNIDSEHLTILRQKEGKSGKKEALKLGIENAKGDLLLFTDADCTVGAKWLHAHAQAHFEMNAAMITAPVNLYSGNSVIESFQVLDTNGMMAITAHGIHAKDFYLANGANMSYRRSIFEELNGFEGNEDFASGDDLFIMHKMAQRDPSRIFFLKSKMAEVGTASVKTFKDLLSQRKRWAGKTRAYTDKGLQFLLVMIFLFNLSLCFNLLVGPFIGGTLFFIGLLQLLMKGVLDFVFLNNMTQYFDRFEDLKRFLPSSILAIWNVLYSGWTAIFSRSYSWKGRKQN